MPGEWEDMGGWEDVVRATPKQRLAEGMMEIPSRPREFVGHAEGPARMINPKVGTRPAPSGDILDRIAYEGGGKVTDFAARAGLPPEVAGGLGYAANVSLQALPMLFGGEASKVVSPAMQSGARSLMQSAVKPTIQQLKSGDAATAIDTMLKEGINPTKGGVAKLQGRIDELNDQIKAAISASPATVRLDKVGASLLDRWNQVLRQANPQGDLQALQKAWTEFRQHPMFAGKSEIPVQTAQEIKQGTYRAMGEKVYGEEKSATIETQKQIARGLKEQIAAKVPQIAGLNAEESRLITTMNVAERRALMELNKNPMGLSLLAKDPKAWAAFMADKSAIFKSLAARMLYSGSEAIPANVGRGSIALSEIATNQ